MNDMTNGDRESPRQLVPVNGSGAPALRDAYGRPGPYGYGDYLDHEAPGPGFDYMEYLRILLKRKWLILTIALAFAVNTAISNFMQVPVYTSTARIQIDREPSVLPTGNILAQGSEHEFMETQYKLLQGRTIAERVVAALSLHEDRDFLQPKRGFSISGMVMSLLGLVPSSSGTQRDRIAAKNWATGRVLSGRNISPVQGSRLIDVSFTDTEPNRAQRVANAYAEAFISLNVDKRFQANESAKVFLEDKIAQLKKRVEDSERALVDFARDEQIISVDSAEKSSIPEGNLAAAETELSTLISERTKNEELWKQFDKMDAANLPQVIQNSVIAGLRSQRTDLEIEYQEKLKTFKPAYPTMVQIRSKMREIDRQIAKEIETTKASLKAAYESTRVQEEATRKRVGELKNNLLDLQQRSIQYNILKREANTNRDLYQSLLERYKQVDLASGVAANTVFVADRAAPGSRSSVGMFNNLLKSLLLGLALGGAAAYVLERLDDKVYSPEQAEAVTGLSTLGVVPKVRQLEKELADPQSSLSESYRSLCTALQFTTENGLPKTISITSAGPAEGKSLTAMCVAKHFATMGRKVLLVDADLRNPSQHVKFGCDNSVGVSNYLTGGCAPPEVMQKTDIPTLAVIASGPLPPNAADLLSGARLTSLMSIGQEIFDLIVIDGPPVLGLADAQLLSSAAEATLFIVGAGVTRKSRIRGAMQRLQLARGVVFGVALTQYDTKLSGYGYGYGYGYGGPRGLSVATSGAEQPQLTHSA